MARTRIKVCGVMNVEEALAAAQAGADAVGLRFGVRGDRQINADQAYEIMASLPPMVVSVGVFRDVGLDEFSDLEEQCPTIHSQLCGDEDEGLVEGCGPDVIKVVRFDEATISQQLARWDEVDEVCAIMVVGETGEGEFDWGRLTPHLERISKPIILSGGLNAGNVGLAIREVRPWGVDVMGSSDQRVVDEFCLAVFAADRE